GKNSLNRLIRCVCGKKIGPDPRNFNQRVSLGRNDLLIRTFPKTKLRIDVYRRLRYVESDHVVFDPITGREVPAERTCINKLIEALVDESNDISKRN
ncbi:hypothetical protein KVP20_24725, partial [Klebsiella pneumoniae]|nr:hypothetical protein [Klebsiella pneumoniae]